MNREQFLGWAQGIYQGARSTVRQVPADKINDRLAPDMMSNGQLIRHIASACGGSLKHLLENEMPPPEGGGELPGVDFYKPYNTTKEALDHLDRDEAVLRETIMGLSEDDFQNRQFQLPWAPMKVPVWEFALMMADHLSIHRAQLHQNLKARGVPVNTMTLYGMG